MPLLPQARYYTFLIGLFCLLVIHLTTFSAPAQSKSSVPSILPPSADPAVPVPVPDLPSTRKLDPTTPTPAPAAAEGSSATQNRDPALEVSKMPKVHFGAADEKDPFGVDYNGPFDKNPRLANDTEKRKFTLKMVVDALLVQAILPDTSEAMINSNLFKEGDKFNVKWINEVFTITLKAVESDKLHFTWNKDTKEVIYLAPSQADYLTPAEDDPMRALQQPPLPVINLNPSIPTTSTKPNQPIKR